MEFAADQLDELREHFPDLKVAIEAGKPYILLSPLALPAGCSPQTVDGLLCPTDRDGYTSRLFFSEKISGGRAGLNWNADGTRILERNWFAYSWKTNRDNLRLWQMVLDHLAALR
jgi:hypothetical protein